MPNIMSWYLQELCSILLCLARGAAIPCAHVMIGSKDRNQVVVVPIEKWGAKLALPMLCLFLLHCYLELLSIMGTTPKQEAHFTLRILFLLYSPFLFLGTSFMAVILWKVQRQRSIYGSLLKNWLITEAVLMSGSMINTQAGSSDIPTVREQLPACSYSKEFPGRNLRKQRDCSVADVN